MDADSGQRRDLHAAARHHGREHGAAVDPARTWTRASPTFSGWSTPTRCRSPRSCSPRACSPTGSAAGASSPSASASSRSPRCSAGLAPDPTFLNIARAIQGIGGAMMFAVSLALIAQEFRAGRERGMAMGVYGATIGVAVAIGPLVGGALTESLGWESIFFLNVPIGIAAIVITYRSCARRATPTRRGSTGPAWSRSRARCSCSCSACCAATTRAGARRLIVSLFAGAGRADGGVPRDRDARQRADAAAAAVPQAAPSPACSSRPLAVSASMFALFLYLTLYLQGFLGDSPLEAGLRYLPLTVTTFFVVGRDGRAALARSRRGSCSRGGLALVGVGAAADGRRRHRRRVDRRCCPASSSPAPASAWSTR